MFTVFYPKTTNDSNAYAAIDGKLIPVYMQPMPHIAYNGIRYEVNIEESVVGVLFDARIKDGDEQMRPMQEIIGYHTAEITKRVSKEFAKGSLTKIEFDSIIANLTTIKELTCHKLEDGSKPE